MLDDRVMGDLALMSQLVVPLSGRQTVTDVESEGQTHKINQILSLKV